MKNITNFVNFVNFVRSTGTYVLGSTGTPFVSIKWCTSCYVCPYINPCHRMQPQQHAACKQSTAAYAPMMISSCGTYLLCKSEIRSFRPPANIYACCIVARLKSRKIVASFINSLSRLVVLRLKISSWNLSCMCS